MVFLGADDLVILMPFSRQNDGISGLGILNRVENSFSAVFHNHIRGMVTLHTGQDILNDRAGLFRTGVIGGNDNKIRIFRRRFGH